MIYARQAVAFTQNDIRSRAVAIRLLGGVHLYQGHYDSALICSQLAYQLSVQTNDSILISSAYNNIGFTQYHFGNYTSALENLLKSLKMKYKVHNTYGLAQTINNIGLVYTKLKDFRNARYYFTEALAVAEKTNDANQKLYSSNNIGFTYLGEQNYTEAESYFLKSLDVAHTTTNNNWMATAYSGLGQVKLKQLKIGEAASLLKKSLDLRTEISDLTGISETYFLLSQVDAARNRYDSALHKIHYSQALAASIGSKNRQLENYDWLTSLFVLKKQYDSALYYQNLYLQLKDSLFNENMARELTEIELKMTEDENSALLASQKAQLQRRSEQIVLLSLVVLFLVVIGLITYYHYRRKKKLSQALIAKNIEVINQKEEITQQQEALLLSNEELASAKEQIYQQNELLITLNGKLQATVDLRTQELESVNQELKYTSLELDNFVYRSSHDLRGPLVRLLGLCQVALMDVDDQKAREYFVHLYETSQQLNELFDRLRYVSEINSIDVNQNPVLIDFSGLIYRVKLRLEKLETYDSIRFIEKIEDGIAYHADAVLMEAIIYGLLENAVRFQKTSEESGKFVKIKVKRKNKKLLLFFSDNGIGIKESEADYIFQMFTVAARDKKTVGLGLYIVKQAVEKLGGSIGLVKNKSGFTRFRVALPIKEMP